MKPAALLVLFAAIVSEVVGTAGLKASEGFSKVVPVAVVVVLAVWDTLTHRKPARPKQQATT